MSERDIKVPFDGPAVQKGTLSDRLEAFARSCDAVGGSMKRDAIDLREAARLLREIGH